ncbi:N-acetylmuramoyl-L-alanine amidase [Psychroserpens sp.]|uniref:N-acetylmuramoyl-L-alanine amidase family protein n=1 Tax=Psychroserpens sp. TaxID=2020870 RepID=UPI00385FB9E7
MKTNLQHIFVSIVLIFTCFLTSANSNVNAKDKFVVVLDAGHGGKDPGKPSKKGYKEKDIALKIVLAIGKELEKNPDIKVVYTRKTDVFIGLFQRGKIANKAKADLFVSIHCNAHNTQAYGSETYVLGLHRNETNFNVAKAENEVISYEEDYQKTYAGFDPNSPESYIGLTLMQEEYLDQSIQLASNIQKQFTHKLKRKNRGVKQAGFIVLHQTVMPSVLVETGFITNNHEGKYLNSGKGQKELATAIKDAILEYKNSVQQNVSGHVFDDSTPINEDLVNDEVLTYDDIVFKVQIAASSRNLKAKSYNFKGLSDISKVKVGKLYKYYYGNTSDLNEIRRLETIAKEKGYTSSFVVAFKDGEQIKLSEALKTSKN